MQQNNDYIQTIVYYIESDNAFLFYQMKTFCQYTKEVSAYPFGISKRVRK